MATFLRVIEPTESTLVAVAWQDALTRMGWEQTEDTGQLDPRTDPWPESPGPWGFQCWRPGDGLGGLVLKISWRRASSHITADFEIGAGTDGAGGFVGPTWTAVSGGAASPSDSQTLMMGGDSSGFYAAMGYNRDVTNPSGLRGAVIVDRTRDVNGEPTTDGAGFLHNLGGGTGTFRTIRVGKPGDEAWTGGDSNAGLPLYPLFAASEASSDGGSYSADDFSTPVFPSVLAGLGVPTWVSPLFVGVHPIDIPAGLTVDIAGRSRHYRRVRSGPFTSSGASPGLALAVTERTGSAASVWPMMLWED